MRIERIVVSAQRKVPHPEEEFSSLSSLVSLEARLDEGDVAGAVVLRLQAEAEDLVEQHLRKVTTRIGAQRRLERASERARSGTESKAAALVEKHGGRLGA